jgi:DNA repair protein RecO (recombination protein O)
MSKLATRALDAPAFVLHSTAWRENSLIVKAFSQEVGVVTLVAKGAKRPYSGLRSVLLPFQPLLLSWSGRLEVKTLTRAEAAAIMPMPGSAMMSCWYMNELLLKLLAPEDPHPGLFDAYARALSSLAVGEMPGPVLRRFEWVLLRETGYGMEGPEPDFSLAQCKQMLQQRLFALLPGAELVSRQVMQSLKRYSLSEPVNRSEQPDL